MSILARVLSDIESFSHSVNLSYVLQSWQAIFNNTLKINKISSNVQSLETLNKMMSMPYLLACVSRVMPLASISRKK